MTQAKVGVNTLRWKMKVKRLEWVMAVEAPKIAARGSQMVHKATIKNLSGTVSGKMPIPRITGTLARAQKVQKIGWAAFIHFNDPTIAAYGKMVHNGTRYMRPRPFRGAVIQERRQAIQNMWRYELIKQIRKVGLS